MSESYTTLKKESPLNDLANNKNVFEVGSEELIYDEIDFDFLGRATVKGKVLIFKDNDGDRCWLIKTPKHGFKAVKLRKLINNNFLGQRNPVGGCEIVQECASHKEV